tara:strand:+ start:157 stop:717 length:561 start_codon:yes stop_codon:yes gene_type:complete
MPINSTQNPIVAQSKLEFGRYGKHMSSLSHDEQEFMEFYLLAGGDNLKKIAAQVNMEYRAAWRLVREERFQKAMKEEAIKRIGAAPALAAEIVVQIMTDPTVTPRVRLTAAEMIFDRVGMHKKSEIIHKTENSSLEEMLASARQKMAALGMDADAVLANIGFKPGEVVDAEFEEVPDGLEGLEDVI